MKLKIIGICIAFISTISIAQTKVGTIDSDYIMNLMPETQIVVKRSQNYGLKLDSSFSIKLKEYQDKVAIFQKTEKTILPLAKRNAIQELTDLETDVKKYQENGQKLMQLKREELMRPLYKKLSDAIKEVAKANNYTQILTLTGNQFAYIDNKFDITELVMKKLGIKKPEESK
jgi:outer membrane protein